MSVSPRAFRESFAGSLRGGLLRVLATCLLGGPLLANAIEFDEIRPYEDVYRISARATGPDLIEVFQEPATKGVYTISRNPMYFSMFLIFVGISLACASWLFLLLTIIWIIIADIGIVGEERICLETYGDSYREYMDRTPRWIGIPKSKETE